MLTLKGLPNEVLRSFLIVFYWSLEVDFLAISTILLAMNVYKDIEIPHNTVDE